MLAMILFISSVILSPDRVLISSLHFWIAAMVGTAMWNSLPGLDNLQRKRIALNILKASSVNVWTGSMGVRMIPTWRSLIPSNGSTSSP